MQEIGFCTLEDVCPYLKDRRARNEYKYIEDCSKDLNSELIFRGWRRFGNYFSRPVCAGCEECLSVRIVAGEFKLGKGDRRIVRKNLNANVKILLRKPTVSDEHLFLYDKYHRFMEERRAWRRYDLNFRKYYNLYVEGASDFGYELVFFIEDKLICVDLIDILNDGISSIYCFYDPDFSHLSLGKFSLLNEIKMAQDYGLEYIYLGYWVKKCQSLSYKADYTPSEILRGTSLPCEKWPLWEGKNADCSELGDN